MGAITAFDLSNSTSGVGPDVLADQLNNLPVGLWTGLEGLWLIVITGGVTAWVSGRRWWTAAAAAVVGAGLVAAFSVFDVTRSLIYIYPAALLGLAALQRAPAAHVRRVAAAAFLACLIWPLCTAAGRNAVEWTYPLPLQLARWTTGIG